MTGFGPFQPPPAKRGLRFFFRASGGGGVSAGKQRPDSRSRNQIRQAGRGGGAGGL
jgi:hypothetical protein